MDNFTYDPLDTSKRQIRLLHLHPASERSSDRSINAEDGFKSPAGDNGDDRFREDDPNDPADIYCTFSLASLDENPEFEAISYVWGDPDDLVTVYLHGCTVKITRSLHAALVHIRQDTTRVLWADALCINQSDLIERASQVRLMGSIYGQAFTVVVYLGPWSNAEVGFRFIKAFGTDPEEHHHDPDATSSLLRSAGLDLTPEIARTYLREFFSLSWWSRVWTVQEYALAHEAVFQSGNQLLSSGSVDDMIFIFDHTSCCGRGGRSQNSWLPMSRDDLHAAGIFKGLFLFELSNTGLRQELNPFSVLSSFRNRQCSDPLDMIYGALALTDPVFRSNIELDYSSCPRHVYTNATMAYIHVSESLDALSYISSRTASLDIPTYVTDFSAKSGLENTYREVDRNRYMLPQYNASKTSTPKIILQSSLEASTQAIFIDTIQENVHTEMIEQTYVSSAGIAQHLISRYSSPATASWQTLCVGLIDDNLPHNADDYRPILDSDYPIYLNWLAKKDTDAARDTTGVAEFDAAIFIGQAGRFYATTRTGYLGLVPKNARIGDCIVLMPGGRVPYVLRPVESSDGTEPSSLVEGGRYEFIGDCYIHGIMHGEAWDESKLQDIILV